MNVGSGSVGFFTYSSDFNICGAPGTTSTFHISSGTILIKPLTVVTPYSATFTAST